MQRPWAFWRRVQYASGMAAVCAVFLAVGYVSWFYAPPSCSDGRQNGDERGVDCGGACDRVCALDTVEPVVAWSRAFRIAEGRYNAVAYVENRNGMFGTADLSYTFLFYDEGGALIAERTGVTTLPPDGVYPIFAGPIQTDRAIARAFIELETITEWEVMEAGREQFEVRDRTLQSADASPRLSARIYNTSLEDAEDVEIVATIFDARGNALTSSQSTVPLFAGREERTVVFTWPEPIAKTVRSCEVPSDVILAIDLSGSMNDDGGTPPEPITSVLDAATAFVGRLRAGDQVGLVTYATTAEQPRGLAGISDEIGAAIRALRITPAAETGATNIGDALRLAGAELNSIRHDENARKVVVVLTDGRANAPGEDPEAYAIEAARTLHGEDVEVFAIGLGTNVNEEFLAAIASSEERRYLAADAANLDAIYRSISTALCEEGAAVIDIVAKTAPR